MTVVPFDKLGSVGIIKDLPDHQLPPEAWTDGLNIRFIDGKAARIKGDQEVFGTPTQAPYWGIFVPTADNRYWVYASLTDIFSYDVATAVHTEITRVSGDYTGDFSNKWNGCIFQGLPVITNGKDVPQVWNPPSAGTKLVDLTNWPSGDSCRYVRAFKSNIVALDVTKSGTRYQHMVKISHPADPGTVPSSWDETDPTKDVYEKDLSDVRGGAILDGLGLRDSFMIYKEGSTWGLNFIGGRSLWRPFEVFQFSGILTTNCVRPVIGRNRSGAVHFVATGDDIITHDGNAATSLIDQKRKRWLSNNIDTTAFVNSYCVLNPLNSEMWFCFPKPGATYPDHALIWNYNDNTVFDRALSEAAFIAPGAVALTIPGGALTWATVTETWDTIDELWDESVFGQALNNLVLFDPTNIKARQLDITNQFSGVNFSSYLERTGLAIVGRDRQGNPIVDLDSIKTVSRIWVRASGDPFTVRVGSQEQIDGDITWTDPVSFDPSTDKFIDLLDSFVPGRLIAVRFESNTNGYWALSGYDLDVSIIGRGA